MASFDPSRAITRRIMGIETEYGIACMGPTGAVAKPADEVARLAFRPLVESYNSTNVFICLLYTSPSPRDRQKSRMPSSA